MVLMGTTHRSIAPDARIGIHRPSLLDSDDATLVASMEESIAHYATQMTGSRRIVGAMMSIPSDRVRYLRPADLASYGIAVSVAGRTGSIPR